MTRPVCAECVDAETGLSPVTIRKRTIRGRQKITVLLCARCREGTSLRGQLPAAGVSQQEPSRVPSYLGRSRR